MPGMGRLEMREIKFRLWNPQEKKMFYDVQDCFHDNYGDGVFGEHGFNEILEDEKEGRCVLMQYTVLKDKDGKEIYEGDIVQVNHPHKNRKYRGQVIWNEYRWTGKDFFFSHFDVPQDLFCEGTEYIEVIGNIYENPELLEKK